MTSLAPSSSLRDCQGGPAGVLSIGRPSTRLIGVRQIARILAVSVAEARELVRLPEFPAPVGEICDHVLWSREDITVWRRHQPWPLSAEDQPGGHLR
jgi:hypothetical protein